MTMTVTQRTELFHLRMALRCAWGSRDADAKSPLSVDDAEAQMDDYDDHLRALVEKTQAAIRILETAE